MFRRSIYRYALTLLPVLMSGCFRPAIPISTGPKYPVDLFYADQSPGRTYDELKFLYITDEKPIEQNQRIKGGRMLGRGNTMLDKDALMGKLTLQAKRLGADALINVKYQYFTTATVNGYSLEGLAVKYKQEREVN
ncbi:hypothetical protein [Fibrella forsythiae]|uniref:Lipoprotein n=1 Tax=Fibrella forsythiae TaxID=2817061 RepID=A0ABS3JCW7_9BACT|nr:hypothetical protein [Fibrella forsythiae]MBO0947840.1 hypothetical protein [Fibrella forsythiae]